MSDMAFVDEPLRVKDRQDLINSSGIAKLQDTIESSSIAKRSTLIDDSVTGKNKK